MMNIGTVLLLTGTVTAAAGGAVLWKAPGEKDFERMKAVLAGRYGPKAMSSSVEQIVELTLNGEPRRVTCQNMKAVNATEKIGDEISVLCRRTKTLGVEAVDIVADKPGELKRYLRKTKAASYFLMAMGAVFAAIGLLIM